MNLTAFYAIVAGTSFTLVGLWWGAVDHRRDLLVGAASRRHVGGVYLTFLLPGLMGLFAEIAPAEVGLWRWTFALVAAVGAWSTLRLMSQDQGTGPEGPFSRHRWAVGVLYVLVLLLGAFPELASVVGLSGLQAAALTLVCLIVLAHGLAWELLTTTAPDNSEDTTTEKRA